MCPACGKTVGNTDKFCAACGAALTTAAAQPTLTPPGGDARTVQRHRLGGTAYLATLPDSTEVEDDATAEVHAILNMSTDPTRVSGTGSTRSRSRSGKRRKRRRHWYRRPILVVPLVAMMLLITVGAGLAWRATTTVNSLQQISTPPPAVDVAADEEDMAEVGGGHATPVTVDTAPAQQALVDAGYKPKDNGGVVDRVRVMSDVAQGASVAAGIGNASAEPMTILIMGVDARPGDAIDIGVRPDVLMIVRLDPSAGGCRLMSIPRDTRTELPGYGLSKVNHALAVGGIPYQLMVTENLLGIKIDHYALINFEGFRDLVDAVGGIPVDVPKTVTKEGVTIQAGQQTLDGKEALAYARYRDKPTEGDAGRIKRQWAILRGLGEVGKNRDLIGEMNSILPAIESHIRSDMTPSEMISIGKTYSKGCDANTVEPTMLTGTRIKLKDPILQQIVYYNIVDEAIVKRDVDELMSSSGTK
jgi:LCP family protein required for cell wall assembly